MYNQLFNLANIILYLTILKTEILYLTILKTNDFIKTSFSIKYLIKIRDIVAIKVFA